MTMDRPAQAQRLAADARLPRHQHGEAYAAFVLSGTYEEMGSSGRMRVAAGDVVLHPPFEAHVNRVGQRGAKVFNLPLPMAAVPASVVVTTDCLDEVMRVATVEPVEAVRLLLETSYPVKREGVCNAADELARAIRRNPALRIEEWAAGRGISRFRLSREFSLQYGVSPARFRAEVRAHKAWRDIVRGSSALADVALKTGHCDQAHMCHAVRMLTGRSPSQWRTHIRTSHTAAASVFHTHGTHERCNEEI